MPGPTIPSFYRGQPEMSEEDAIKSEQGYYGPPPLGLEAVPTDLWGARNIDLAQPAQGDAGAMQKRQYKRPPGRWFVDQVENGIARVEDPEGNVMTMRAQPGWKEGMDIDPPRTAPRKRVAVP